MKSIFQKQDYDSCHRCSSYEAWQGGDLVIFKSHIGIVSDHRNKHGVPYVMHHNEPFQTRYEQIIPEHRHDRVRHYRMSK